MSAQVKTKTPPAKQSELVEQAFANLLDVRAAHHLADLEAVEVREELALLDGLRGELARGACVEQSPLTSRAFGPISAVFAQNCIRSRLF